MTQDIEIPGWDTVEAAGRVDPAPARVLAAADRRWRPAPQRSRWRGPRVVLAAAAVAASALVAIPLLGPGAASAEAAEVLDRAAAAVVDTGSPGPGQFWRVETAGVYTATVVDGGSASTYLEEQRRTTWIPADPTQPHWWDDSRRLVEVVDGDVPLEEARRQFPDSREVLKIVTSGPVVPSWQGPTVDWLAGLPRDPALLRERLYADSAGMGSSADGEVLVYVADVLRSGIVPPDLRVALYEVLITVPGVEVTEADAELFGRSGVALGRAELFRGGDRQEIVIDPETGDYLGDRYVSPEGTVSYGSVATTIVDAVPADIEAAAEVMNCVREADGATVCE